MQKKCFSSTISLIVSYQTVSINSSYTFTHSSNFVITSSRYQPIYIVSHMKWTPLQPCTFRPPKLSSSKFWTTLYSLLDIYFVLYHEHFVKGEYVIIYAHEKIQSIFQLCLLNIIFKSLIIILDILKNNNKYTPSINGHYQKLPLFFQLSQNLFFYLFFVTDFRFH